MTTISCKPILRSRNCAAPDKVLSTFLMRYPRWIHAEQRTHRLIPLDEGEEDFWAPSTPSLMADSNLSRNAASSRAIPVKKLIDDVIADPAVPLFWGGNQRGMQSGAEINSRVSIGGFSLDRETAWLAAMNAAIEAAQAFDAAGYHKQIVNRLLEPFSHITVLVSATEWDNFLELRDHADAEPHIAMLAREVRRELERTDNIQELRPGELHLPFMRPDVSASIWTSIGKGDYFLALQKFSVACCASTSFKTVEGFDMTIERAFAIYDKLITSRPIHASPAEHVAMADEWIVSDIAGAGWQHRNQHGNFVGFRQHRHMIG